MVVQNHAQKVDVSVADWLWLEEVVREDLDPVADSRRLRVAEVWAVGNYVWHVLCDEPEAGEGFCERDANATWCATDLRRRISYGLRKRRYINLLSRCH